MVSLQFLSLLGDGAEEQTGNLSFLSLEMLDLTEVPLTSKYQNVSIPNHLEAHKCSHQTARVSSSYHILSCGNKPAETSL